MGERASLGDEPRADDRPVPDTPGTFAVTLDLVDHRIDVSTSWGASKGFELSACSVAQAYERILAELAEAEVTAVIDPMPQEVPHPVRCDEDTEYRPYDAALANAWWRALVSSEQVMKRYHARYWGPTPPIGLMWGTFDLRDVRLNGPRIMPGPRSATYAGTPWIANRSKAAGGSDPSAYPRPAYFSFTYPEPEGIERAELAAGRWEESLGLFVLDYEDVRVDANPPRCCSGFSIRATRRVPRQPDGIVTS